jgi:chorismate dehydratase
MIREPHASGAPLEREASERARDRTDEVRRGNASAASRRQRGEGAAEAGSAGPQASPAGRVRLGRISYVNMAPIFFGLDADVEEVAGVPTELNESVLAGEIDLAPISSIEYGRHSERLRVLPRLCVSSEGAVDSIQLVSRAPLGSVSSVAVTPESATSAVLVRVLLPEAEQVPLGEEADAKLLIGDAALKSMFEDPTPHYDLGRLWLERTGLPMVYAVFACPDPPPHGVAELEAAFLRALRANRAEPERLAREASARYGYPAGFLARYFEKLRYRFGPKERAGLLSFFELAVEAGELEHLPELRFLATEVVTA